MTTYADETTRISHGYHLFGPHRIAHTDLNFRWRGEWYGARYNGHLTPIDVSVMWDEFMRRHGAASGDDEEKLT